MELKNFGLSPNTQYNGEYLVKKKNENGYYSISRTANKIIFYWGDEETERRLFLKKIEDIKESEKDPQYPHTEVVEEDDVPGGGFDSEALKKEANKESFLFFSEDNPFFNNDFTWAEELDFAKDNDLMYQ